MEGVQAGGAAPANTEAYRLLEAIGRGLTGSWRQYDDAVVYGGTLAET